MTSQSSTFHLAVPSSWWNTGYPPIHRNHDAIPGEKRNQGYRNGILVIMIYPLYPCINISVVWHIFRHLLVKYTMYRLQWHSSTQVPRKSSKGSESVKIKTTGKTRIFQLSPPWQLDIVDPQNLRVSLQGGRTLKNIELRDSKNSFKLMSRIQQKSRNESQKTPRFSLKSVTHLQSSAHKHKMPTSRTRGNKKMPFSTGTMPQLEN